MDRTNIKKSIKEGKKDIQELHKNILKSQILIRKIKFGGKNKEKNVKKTRELKKEIARLKTKGF